jgi:hypothetical protein
MQSIFLMTPTYSQTRLLFMHLLEVEATWKEVVGGSEMASMREYHLANTLPSL